MSDLAGTRWLAEEVAGQRVLATHAASIEFDQEGAAYGSTGVNRFRGPYELDGDQLSFGAVITTMMAGPPDAMAQEQAWLRILETARSFRREVDRLEIVADGESIVLRPDDSIREL